MSAAAGRCDRWVLASPRTARDALSFVLNVGDREILVDPGTYAYHTDPAWRRYFRSTLAHNTVGVDGEDQSVQAGNFMWTHHARARCIEFDAGGDTQRFVGEHHGYWRWRIGDYRVVARIDEERITILVVRVAHRREVYR